MGKRFLSSGIGLLSLVLLMPGVFGAIEADFYVVDVQPKQVHPGETTTLNITLKNLGPEFAAYVRATLDPYDTSPIDPVGISKKYLNKAERAQKSTEYFGLILQRDEVDISFPIRVNRNTAEDVYQTPLLIEWKDADLAYKNQTLKIALYVRGEPELRIAKVRTVPQELKSDTENSDVIVTVENSGNAAAKSVRVTVALEEPFSEAYSSSGSDFVAEIPKDMTHDFVLSVDIDENAEAGRYTFPLMVTYRDDDREYTIEEELTLEVESRAAFEVREVKTEPELITPGDDFRINVVLVNSGQRDAESVKAVLKTKSYFTGVKTDYLGDIEVGESRIATFELEADRDTMPDNYGNDIKIIWSEGDKRLEEIHSFGITVQAKNNMAPIKLAGALAAAIVGGLILWRKKR
ncbi:COG1361 S-layer family protein [Candidatus Pyrohabitans sp.]